MKTLSLAGRLGLFFLIVAVLPLAGMAWFYLENLERTLVDTLRQNLVAVADRKAEQIDAFINERLDDAQSLGRSRLAQEALRQLGQAYARDGKVPDGELVTRFERELSSLISVRHYHDLLLIDRQGTVLFSLKHEDDLGSNLYYGPYRQSSLATGFRQAMATLHTDLSPFAPYAPSTGKVAAFLVVPVLDRGRLTGALALQFNLDTLLPVVNDHTGLGNSGAIIVAEQDGGVARFAELSRRANARVFTRQQSLEQLPTVLQQALAGGHDNGLDTDFEGNRVAAAWRYIPSLRWGMVVKIDRAEVLAPVREIRQMLVLALALSLLFSTAAAFLLGRRLVRNEGVIAAQEARYRAMFGSMNDGVALYRPTADGQDFVFVDFNAAAERITGWRRDQVQGKTAREIFPGLEEAGILPALRRVAQSGQPECVALTNYQDNRLHLWVDNDVVRLPDGNVLSVFKDITARKQAESELSLYASIFQHSGEAILVSDTGNRIVAVNPAFCRLTGYEPAEVIGRNPNLLASGKTPPATYQAMWADLHGSGFWQGELWDRTKAGEIYPKWAAISVIRDAQGHITHYIASFTDISERKAAEARIEHLAHHDTLTGLFNRYSLENRLDQALATARRQGRHVVAMFIDLDRFKFINDTLGHAIGDQLLIDVAQRLRGCVRDSDIVARQGGDEFVVVLTGLLDGMEAMPVAADILHTLGQTYRINGNDLHTTPSIGVAVFPGDGADVAQLLKNADIAMYAAKSQGRNNVQYFTAAMNNAANERLQLENELRHALERQQLELYYQPQMVAGSGQLYGFEALLRWRHPVQGLVPPLKFIPLAEEIGLIEEIGHWVLEEACRQLALWKQAGHGPLRMAVNLSAQQLRSARLVDTVRSCLEHHRLTAGELELEITESVAMENPERAINLLEGLHALGVQLAIDDFGTGYSSLAYLKHLPIQTLKLDRTFVRDIETDANDAAISTATIALAHSLGLKVVAEGVETPAQRDFLLAHGCDLLQGYLFGKPTPAADAPLPPANSHPSPEVT